MVVWIWVMRRWRRGEGLMLPSGVGTRGWVGAGHGRCKVVVVGGGMCARQLWLSAGCALDILSLVAFVFGQSLVGCA